MDATNPKLEHDRAHPEERCEGVGGATKATSLKLELVRIYLGEQRMDVGVFDPMSEAKRLVKVSWNQVPPTDIPPDSWYSTVAGEVEYQRGQDQARADGRFIPR